MKRLRSPAGFTLPELLVAGALMVLISLELSRTFMYTFKAQRHIAQTTDALEAENILRLTLSNSSGCQSTVAGLDPTTTANQTFPLKSGPSSTALQVGTVFGKTRVAELYATFLQTTGTQRLAKVTMRVEKIGDPGLRADWTYEAYFNATVNSSNVAVGCATTQGSLLKMESYDSRYQPTGMGYEFSYAASGSSTYDSGSDMWRIKTPMVHYNCALTNPDRDKGCVWESYPNITVTALGTLTTFQAKSAVCVTNPQSSPTFAGIASVQVNCGSTVRWTNVASMSNNNNNALCLNGTTLRLFFTTTPGQTCTVAPFLGYSWWPPPPTGPNPVPAGADLKVIGYPFNITVEHYQ